MDKVPHQSQNDTVDAGLVSNLRDVESGESTLPNQTLSSRPTYIDEQQSTIEKVVNQCKASDNRKTTRNPCDQLPVPDYNLSFANELNDNEKTCEKQQKQYSNGLAAALDVVKSGTVAVAEPTPAHTNVDLTSAFLVNGEKAAIHATSAKVKVNANNGGDDDNDTTDHKQQKLSSKIVVLLRRSKPIVLVLINCVLAVLIATSVCVTMGFDYTVPAIVCGLIAIVASSGLWYWLYIAAVTAPRDIRALLRYIKLLVLVRRCQRKNIAVWDLFHHYVAKHPQKACIIYEGKEWSFREMNDLSNRIANVFQQNGYKKGDVVGLLMDNRPEFVAFWLGLSKIGVIVPLINTNQRQASLIHSVEIAKCQALIYGESLESAVEEVIDRFKSHGALKLYQYNDDKRDIADKSIINLNSLLENATKTDVSVSSSKDTHHGQLLYIYTSGTTGLPKAAVITHSRYIFIAAGIHYLANFTSDDIFYTEKKTISQFKFYA